MKIIKSSFTGTMGLGSFDIGLNFTYKDHYSIDNSLLSDENTRKFSKQYGPDYTISDCTNSYRKNLDTHLYFQDLECKLINLKQKIFGDSGKDISTRDRKNQFFS